MKRLVISALAGLGLCCACFLASAQHEITEHISKQFTLSKGTVAVYNIWGSVNVEGYGGDKVMMEIDQTLSANDEQTLAKAKQEFKLGFDEKGDTVMAYIEAPYDTRPHNNHYNEDNKHQVDYRCKLNYTIKVPYNLNLEVTTVNEGQVLIKNVYGRLRAGNVNGGIEIVNAKGATRASTVNGPVTVNYLSVPPDESSYNSLNGPITVTYPANLSANVEFKSMNGKFYTDFENVTPLPAKIIKTTNQHNSTTTYKLSKNEDFEIGAGGKLFKFETLNGNIYIKKQ